MGEYRSNREITSGNSALNAFSFFVENILKKQINTAIPVKVVAVETQGSSGAAGYVDVMPLINQRDASNKAIDTVTIFHLPYYRYQGGVAAVVVDPVAGDVGLAIFAQQDCSNLKQSENITVTPGSFRAFSMSDGFYIGGFLNKTPQVFIEIKQDKTVAITASSGVTINAPYVTVPSGDVIASGISLVHHRHPGDSGGTTGEPI